MLPLSVKSAAVAGVTAAAVTVTTNEADDAGSTVAVTTARASFTVPVAASSCSAMVAGASTRVTCGGTTSGDPSAAARTGPVASLVAVSEFPSSSWKLTCTRRYLLWSASTTV